jgi:hypothetical protein
MMRDRNLSDRRARFIYFTSLHFVRKSLRLPLDIDDFSGLAVSQYLVRTSHLSSVNGKPASHPQNSEAAPSHFSPIIQLIKAVALRTTTRSWLAA